MHLHLPRLRQANAQVVPSRIQARYHYSLSPSQIHGTGRLKFACYRKTGISLESDVDPDEDKSKRTPPGHRLAYKPTGRMWLCWRFDICLR